MDFLTSPLHYHCIVHARALRDSLFARQCGFTLEITDDIPHQCSVAGFFLPSHASKYKQHLNKLMKLYQDGVLEVIEDSQRFIGIESVPDAVQRLQSGTSVGKVVVYIDPTCAATQKSQLSKL